MYKGEGKDFFLYIDGIKIPGGSNKFKDSLAKSKGRLNLRTGVSATTKSHTTNPLTSNTNWLKSKL